MTTYPLAALQLLVEEEIANIPLTTYPVINSLNKKVTSQTLISWNANVGGTSVQGGLVTADMTTFTEDTIVPASLPIAIARLSTAFRVNKVQAAQARSRGKGALRDLFAYDVQNGMRELMNQMSTLMYSGTGTDAQGGIVGLNTVVNNAAVYANVSPVTYPGWTAAVSTNNGTARALTVALMETVDIGITRKGMVYDRIFTTPEIVAKYTQLFQTQTSTQVLTSPNGIADAGFTGYFYKGRPIIKDIYCPAGRMYFVDTSKIALYSFQQDNTEDQNGLHFSIGSLPVANTDVDAYAIVVKPQLKVHNRKAVALLGDLQE